MKTTRAGFTLLELLLAVVICGVLTLSSVAVFAGNTDAARAAEARATMLAIKDRARTVYLRNGKPPNTLKELSMSNSEVTTSNFSSQDYKFNSSGKNWKITCERVYLGSNPPHLTINVDLVTGDFEFKR